MMRKEEAQARQAHQAALSAEESERVQALLEEARIASEEADTRREAAQKKEEELHQRELELAVILQKIADAEKGYAEDKAMLEHGLG